MSSAFDLEHYRDRITESERRLALARSFREPDQVPVEISVGGSFYCRLFGHNIADYYRSRELSLEIQLLGLRWAFEELRDDRVDGSIYLDIGPIAEGLLFGAEIVRPDDTSPWSRRMLFDPADVEALEAPDPGRNPAVRWYYDELDKLRDLADRHGLSVPVSGRFGIHPPLSAACALAPPELIYQWMYDEPEVVKQLFAKLLETFCALADYAADRGGGGDGHIGLADDHSAFISEKMYREFVLPCNRAIYERYGTKGRYLHADGPNDHLFRLYANELRLTEMDIGGFSDLAAAKREMHGKTVIMGGLNCKDLYGGFEAARPVVERAVRVGSPGGGYLFGVGGETYAGVNPSTLIEAVRHAQKISRR